MREGSRRSVHRRPGDRRAPRLVEQRRRRRPAPPSKRRARRRRPVGHRPGRHRPGTHRNHPRRTAPRTRPDRRQRHPALGYIDPATGEIARPAAGLDDSFWTARPILDHVRQAARSRLVAPQAVLGAILARIAALSRHPRPACRHPSAPTPHSRCTSPCEATAGRQELPGRHRRRPPPRDHRVLQGPSRLGETSIGAVQVARHDGGTRRRVTGAGDMRLPEHVSPVQHPYRVLARRLHLAFADEKSAALII